MIEQIRADVICDRCGRTHTVVVPSMPRVRHRLRFIGWHCDKRDLCPTCKPAKPAGPATEQGK